MSDFPFVDITTLDELKKTVECYSSDKIPYFILYSPYQESSTTKESVQRVYDYLISNEFNEFISTKNVKLVQISQKLIFDESEIRNYLVKQRISNFFSAGRTDKHDYYYMSLYDPQRQLDSTFTQQLLKATNNTKNVETTCEQDIYNFIKQYVVDKTPNILQNADIYAVLCARNYPDNENDKLYRIEEDPTRLETLLINSGVPKENIIKLRNEEETYDNIMEALDEGIKHDTLIFSISGHGSDGTVSIYDKRLKREALIDKFKDAKNNVFCVINTCYPETMIQEQYIKEIFDKGTIKNFLGWSSAKAAQSTINLGVNKGHAFTFRIVEAYDKSKTYDDLWDYLKTQRVYVENNKNYVNDPVKVVYGQDFSDKLVFTNESKQPIPPPTEKKKRIVLDSVDELDVNKLTNVNGKFNCGDSYRNKNVEIGVWNGNLPIVLKQADLCCIPVLIIKGIGNCGRHWDKLKSSGFKNWQLSCSMYLSYEYCGWEKGYSEQWLTENTYQYDETGFTYCPEYAVHWKDENGKVLNVGKYTDNKNGIITELGLEPWRIEGTLSDYFQKLQSIDMSKCIIDIDGNTSFETMILYSKDNASPYKQDYSNGGVYGNIDNLKSFSEQNDIPMICFYVCNPSVTNPIGRYFPNVKLSEINKWKNDKANILWGCVSSNEKYNIYKNARIDGAWHYWIGDIENNPKWKESELLVKIYDKGRNVNKSFSYELMDSFVCETTDHTTNFINFFTTNLSDYYNGVAKKDVYGVTFCDCDGSKVGETQYVLYGESATPPTVSRNGYVFTKWIPDCNFVSCDITCTAQYNKDYSQDGISDYEESNENPQQNTTNTIRVINSAEFGRNTTRFRYYDKNTHNLRISNNVIGEVLASYNENGLKNQLIEVVNVSKNIRELSAYCFHGCGKIQRLDFHSSNITKMGESCFEGCVELTSLILPQNLDYLEQRMFSDCDKLREIALNFHTFDKMSQNSLLKSNISQIYLNNMTSSDLYQYCSSMLIHFDCNCIEPSGEMTDISLEFGQKWTCPQCGYIKEGYRFVGKWNTKPDGSGEWFIPETEYPFQNVTLTLYAQWKENGRVLAILETCMKSGGGNLLDGCAYAPKIMYEMISKSYDDVDNDVEVHILSDSDKSKFGKYNIESPTKSNILNLLKQGVSGQYDLVIMYLSDHGFTNGDIGIKGGKLNGKEVGEIINEGDKSTRIMLICDMCHAETFSPLTTTYGTMTKTQITSENEDFFEQMFETFNNSKKRLCVGNAKNVTQYTEPKLLGWYTCDAENYGLMEQTIGMRFLARIKSLFLPNKSYDQLFKEMSSLPYWYTMDGEFYGYSSSKPYRDARSAYHKKQNYHNNFDEDLKVFM